MIVRRANITVHEKIIARIKKVLRLYLVWSVAYLPLTLYGWIAEENFELTYLVSCVRNFIFVGENFYSWALWYLNGLIFALVVIDILLNKFSLKKVVGFGTVMYVIGILLTMFENQLVIFPKIIADLISLYFKFFVTTRNGLFQSLVFVSVGMWIAEIEQIDGLWVSTQKKVIVSLVYIIKVFLSLKGGQYLSQIFDLPIFCILFSIIILECKKINLNGKFYEQLRKLSEYIYFIHMYFVALCALVLYRDDYHNFNSFFICAIGAFVISWLLSIAKVRKDRNKLFSGELEIEGNEMLK